VELPRWVQQLGCPRLERGSLDMEVRETQSYTVVVIKQTLLKISRRNFLAGLKVYIIVTYFSRDLLHL